MPINPAQVKWDSPAIDPSAVQWDDEPSFGDQLKRQLGLTARYAIEGPAQLAGIITDPIASGVGALYGQQAEPLASIASRFATNIGLPEPQGAVERVVGDISRGLASGGVAGRTAQLANPTGPVGRAVAGAFYENPALQGASIIGGAGASGVAREAGATPAGQVVAGIAGGLAPSATAALSGTRDPQRRALLQFARQERIPVSAAQASESRPIQNLSASLNENMLFSGASAAAQRQQAAFNRAVSRTFGTELPDLSPQSMQAARASFDQRYRDVFQGNPIVFDTRAASAVNQILNRARNALTAENFAVVQRNAQRVMNEFSNGSVDPALYQNLRGELYDSASMDATGNFVRQLARALDDTAGRSLPAGAKELYDQVNRQYSNFRVTQKALEQIAGAGGDVNPASLWNILKQRGFARSTPEMRRLAELGQQVLKTQIRDSGTIGRAGAYGTLAGGVGVGTGALPPEAVALALGGGTATARLLNSPIGGRMLGLGIMPNAARANRLLELSAPYMTTAQTIERQQ